MWVLIGVGGIVLLLFIVVAGVAWLIASDEESWFRWIDDYQGYHDNRREEV
jgi:hypothetical protein